jgi:hypothetical protein
MDNPNFLEKAEQLARCNLIFPYHIQHSELTKKRYYNKISDEFHEHSFENLLRVVYDEPKAFHLTADDKIYYSEQELRFIEQLRNTCLNN